MTQKQLINKKNSILSSIKAEEALQKHIFSEIQFLRDKYKELALSIDKKYDEMQVLAEQVDSMFIQHCIDNNL